MQVSKIKELQLDEIKEINGGGPKGSVCYVQYVWINPITICEPGPWDSPTYRF